MITIVAKCSVKPYTTEAFLKLACSLVEASRAEAGNVSYDFYCDASDPSLFMFIECWKDKDAINLHNASEHFIYFVEKTASFFIVPLDVKFYQKLI